MSTTPETPNVQAAEPLPPAPGSAFVRHLQSAWEHLHAAEKLYPAGCDAFTVSGHVERAKHDCKQAARLVGGLPNDAEVSDGAGKKQ